MARLPGSINKSRKELMDLVEEACPGFNPVVAMATIAYEGRIPLRDPEGYVIGHVAVDTDQRLTCMKEAAQYLYAKMKAVEHTGEIQTTPQVTVHVPGIAVNLADWGNIVRATGEKAADGVAEPAPSEATGE